MSGEKPLGVTGGAPGPASASTAYHLAITPAMIRAAGAAQSVAWQTPDVPQADRIVALRAALTDLFDFTVPDASKTITFTVTNDGGDVLFTLPIDVAHGTTTAGTDPAHGAGAVPLVVGPYAEQGNNNPLPYKYIITTDAASLSLVSAAVGALWSEVVTQTTTTVTVIP